MEARGGVEEVRFMRSSSEVELGCGQVSRRLSVVEARAKFVTAQRNGVLPRTRRDDASPNCVSFRDSFQCYRGRCCGG